MKILEMQNRKIHKILLLILSFYSFGSFLIGQNGETENIRKICSKNCVNIDSIKYFKYKSYTIVLSISKQVSKGSWDYKAKTIILNDSVFKVVPGESCTPPEAIDAEFYTKRPAYVPLLDKELRDYDCPFCDGEQSSCRCIEINECEKKEYSQVNSWKNALINEKSIVESGQFGRFFYFKLKDSLEFNDLQLKKNDVLVFDTLLSYYITISSQKQMPKYGVISSGDILSVFNLRLGLEYAWFQPLNRRLFFSENGTQVECDYVLKDVKDYSLKAVKTLRASVIKTRSYQTGGSFCFNKDKLIKFSPLENLSLNPSTIVPKGSYIFYKNNIPIAFEFKDKLDIDWISVTGGGIVTLIYGDDNKLNKVFICPNIELKIDGTNYPAKRWLGIDKNMEVFYGFLLQDKVVKGIPLASISSIVKNGGETNVEAVRPFFIYNNKVVEGYLSSNFDHSNFPLQAYKWFKFSPDMQEIIFGYFYKTLNYRSHTYGPSEPLLGTLIIDTTITVLKKDILRSLLYVVGGKLQEETNKKLLEVQDTKHLGKYGQEDITQNMTYNFQRHSIGIKNVVYVKGMLYQYLAQNCDVTIKYNLSFGWKYDINGNYFDFHINKVMLSDIEWDTRSICPLGIGLFSPYIHLIYSFASPFMQLFPENTVLKLGNTINQEIKKLQNLKIGLSIQEIFIENEDLKITAQLRRGLN